MCSRTRGRCVGSSVEVAKIASDLRLLSMGPRAGIAEILLPAVQPGSSIMPGKVNPSVPEMVNQVCCQVIGCDAAILAAADAGQLELNVMMPVIAWNALHATTIFGQAMHVLADTCVSGIMADAVRARELLDRSTALATALSPYIGYAQTAEIAKLSVETGRPIREIVRERRLLPDETLDAILSPEAMTSPGRAGHKEGRQDGESNRTGGARRTRPAGVGRRKPAAAAARRSCSHPKTWPSSRGLIATSGSVPIRSWTPSTSPKAASSLISAPPAAGSPSGSRGGSARTARSTPKISSRR